MGNYGFMVDNDTMQIKRMAPMFDHNQALLPYAEQEDFENLDVYHQDQHRLEKISMRSLMHD